MSFPHRFLRRARVVALAALVVCALAAVLLTSGPIRTARAGNTWQVDKSRPNPGCTSDDLTCKSLKEAVAAADSGDRIRITKGRYDGENDILIENKNLTIIGGGQPQIITLPHGNGTMIDETSGTWITAFNICPVGCSELTSLGRVFRIKNSTVTISGMWITAGNSHGGNGGTILNEGGTLTFSDVKITGDSDGGNGGAVYNDQGTISFTDCSIFGASGSFQTSGPAGGSGGGIYNDRGTLQITRCSVGGNIGHSVLSDGGSGGGLFNKGGTVTITSSAIENSQLGFVSDGNMPGTTPNRAGFNGGRGGGIFNEYPGNVTITDSEIRSNKTSKGGTGGDGAGLTLGSGHPGGNGGPGGGIYNEGDMKIVGCTIAGNQTGEGGVGGSSASSPGSGSDGGVGGGIYNGDTMTIENSTVSDNATGGGGQGGNGTTDATPGGNGGSGGRGGGIYNQNKLTLTNVTITGNTTGGGGAGASSSVDSGTAGSSGHGGGIVNDTSASGTGTTILNTIIAGNTTASGGSDPDVLGTIISSGHNLIGINTGSGFTATGDQKGSSSAPLNAQLGPRQLNGGPTSTFDLLAGSPAINAGDDSVTADPSNLKNDQRGTGYARKYNGHVDIGAIEKQPPSHPPVARCLSSIVSAQTSCQYTLSMSDIDGGSSDEDPGDNITLSLDQSGPLGLGSHSVTLTVTDDRGLSSSCIAQVTVVDDVAPVISALPSHIFFTGPNSTTAGITLSNLDTSLGTATALDNCSGNTAVVLTGVPANNFFPLGTTTLTYTSTDAKGNIATVRRTVEVIDNTPPKITAPADRTLYTGPGATVAGVTVNDLDATLGTPTASDNDSVSSTVRTGVPAGKFFPLGTTTLTYTVTDRSGNTASATQRVLVIDNTAPVISGTSVSLSSLWPANNKTVDILVGYNAGDNSGVVVTVLSISSNEQTNPDDMLVLDNHHVRLRATRAGGGSGRIYTITITASDPYGNSSRRTVAVTVPHDQGK